MKAILRVMYHNRIVDYDLSTWEGNIREENLQVIPTRGQWGYSTGTDMGYLKIGDTILVNREKRIAAFVMEKIEGEAVCVELKDGLSIGRKSGNDIVLNDKMVSGSHCSICRKGSGWYVTDLGSTNGTYINDINVAEAKLKEGDILKLGRYRLKMMKKSLQFMNADDRVTFNVVTRGVSAADVFQPKPYPWFSPAPRMYGALEPLSLSIESAPSVGEKPKMTMGVIALDPKMMAVSLGTQALRYALGKRKHSKQEQQRAEVYANYLTQIEARIQDFEKKQRNYEQKLYPAVTDCVQRAHNMSANLWERHPGDEDFLSLRFGTGTKSSKANIIVPQQRLQLQEDELDKVPQQLKEKYAEVKDMPVFTSLTEQGNLGVIGTRPQTVELAQSMVAQIASLHNYKDVKIIALFPEQEKEAWQWMRWLPHCMSDDRNVRYLACGQKSRDVLEPLEKMVNERMESKDQWSFGRQSSNLPHLVFVVAAPEMLNGTDIGRALMMNQPELGISGIFLGNRMMDFPHSVRNVCEVSGTGAKVLIKLKADGREYSVKKADELLSVEEYEAFARKMAPIRMPGMDSKEQNLPTGISLLDGIGVRDINEIDFEDLWHGNAPESSLAVPIGVRADGSSLYFDIHEKKHGPHGMVAGTAGSGKSEMAQTWIAMMAMQYSPEEVNFVLVDFKGDSLLQPFENLPHLAGRISNLDIDVARKFAAIESELQRRQRVLSDHGCKNIIEYTKKRRMNPGMPVLPYTILVVDEFAEFKTQFPSFAKSLDQVYRVGRSLGFFVILMTQKPSGVVTDQMRANTHFKWCLRVQEDSDSREMIGTTDAAALRVPGRAYVKTKDSYELIQVYYGGAEYKKNQKRESVGGAVYAVALNGERKKYQTAVKKKNGFFKTQLEALVEEIGTYCRRNNIASAEPIWQKELPEKMELFGAELQKRAWDERAGWQEKVTPDAGPAAMLGIVDDPAHQSQYALTHDFWENGNLAVYGMPMSGKTTFLQNMMVSLCSRYTPEDIQFYGIELSGFGLRQLEVFPHVGGAASKDEPEAIEKITGILLGELDKRKKLFRKVGAGSPGMYMEATGESLATIVLMVDNMNLAGMELPAFTNAVLNIAREGNAYGIYVVCSFSGTTGVNYSLIQNFKTAYALELSDKSEYNAIVGRPSGAMPAGIKGRGLLKAMPEPLLFQTAVPFAELSDNKRTLALRDLADRMAKQWKGKGPKKIATVPQEIPFGSLEGEPFTLGLDIEENETVILPFKELVSLLISDASGESEDIVKCLVKQAKAIPESQVYVFHNVSEMEQVVLDTVQELRNRQAMYKQNPTVKFAPIFFILDGYQKLTSECQNEIISRLEVFIRLGKGLGISVIGVDSADKMTKCRFRGDILTVTMQQAAVMLVGGAFHQHQIADVQMLQSAYTQSLDKNEAILLKSNKIEARFIRMLGE